MKLFQTVFESDKVFTIESYAISQANFGSALIELFKQGSSNIYLANAIVAYKEALKEKAIPLNQHERIDVLLDLGFALMSNGNYSEAVSVYRSASSMCMVCARTKGGSWVSARLGLGAALADAAKQDGNLSFLHEAVDVLRATTETIDQSLYPTVWISSQISLGYALTGLGEQSNQSNSLSEAISVIRSALQGIRRDSDTNTWARAQFYLGCALEAQARTSSHSDMFEQANQAYSQALQENRALGANYTQKAQVGVLRTREEVLHRPNIPIARHNQ